MDQATELETDASELPAEPVLKPQLSPAWALRLAHLPAIALIGVLFLLASYMPLRPTDIWGHVAWGNWILEHRQLPAEDPTFVLAAGMPVIDTAWLSQVIFATIDRVGGPEWLSNTFALVTLATWLVIWRVLYLRAGNWLTSFAMLVVVFGIAFSRLTTIRPEIFAWLCFAALWWLITPNRAAVAEDQGAAETIGWRAWIGVPLVMMLWANLHGSFLCGLAVLGASALGALLTTLWHTRSFVKTLQASEVQRWVLLAELALLATLVNPYGVDLLISAVVFARNSNLREVLEWQPFLFGGPGSYEFVGSWVLGTLLLRFSRRSLPLGQVLSLALLGGATLAGNRMIGWFALTFGVAFMPLLDDLLGRLRFVQSLNAPYSGDEEVGRGFPLIDRSWSYSLLALLIMWIAFSLSPTSAPLLGPKSRTAAQLYGPDTPVGLTDYLQKNPIAAPIFCPQWWGDWLHRSAPGAQPFMTSNIHLAPRVVWSDYLRVTGLQAGWGNVLGRYHVEHVVVDKETQPDLERSLRRDTGWRVLYEDQQAVLYALRKPALANRSAPVPSPPKN